MWVCEAGKLMSHCTVGVCECLVFHFSVALHIKNHESPSRPPCQTTPRQLYWCARVCNHSFLFMRSLLCVTLPFFYNLDLFVIHMPNVFMLCLCVMCGCLWRFWLDFFYLIFFYSGRLSEPHITNSIKSILHLKCEYWRLYLLVV